MEARALVTVRVTVWEGIKQQRWRDNSWRSGRKKNKRNQGRDQRKHDAQWVQKNQ